MSFLRNAWYMIGWPDELREAPLVRTVLDMPIIVYRDPDGRPIAMHDMCPHRFAPLSRGKIKGATIQCGYHGLEFDSTGHCIHSPFSRAVPTAARVRTFPIVEQEKVLWIWTGDAEAADPATITRLPHHGDPALRCIFGSTIAHADYRLLIDNLLDLTHITFVHPGFGGDTYIPKVTVTERESGDVAVQYLVENMPNPMPADVPGERVTSRDTIVWSALGNHVLEGRRESLEQPGVDWVNMSAHMLTPASAKSTHYFWSSALDRNSAMTDAVHLAMLDQAFNNEDKPMLEAVQGRMGDHDLLELNPILLKTDSGGVRSRRRLDALLAAERSATGAVPA